MPRIQFRPNPGPTLGVEIELGLVDAQSMDLSNSVRELLPRLPSAMPPFCKPELMQSCIEINSSVCRDIGEIERDLTGKLVEIEKITDAMGLRLWWGGTHPFAAWRDQLITPDARYEVLVQQLQDMARRLVCFGLHVHVGVDSGDKAVMICDRIMQHVPTLLALSANSPYWQGHDSGLQSLRSKIMEGLPTAGLPSLMRNWSEYLWIVNHLIDTELITTIREIWWDVRPQPTFGTVEVRVCDMPGTLRDVLRLTAMTHCLVKHLSDRIDEGTYQLDCHPMVVRQNKWRAGRYGNQARLANSDTFQVQPVRAICAALIERLLPQAEQLHCVEYLREVQQMADERNGSMRQREIYGQTGDLREIVSRLTLDSRISAPPGGA